MAKASMSVTGMEVLLSRTNPSRIIQKMSEVMRSTVDFAKEVQIDAIETSGTSNSWDDDWGHWPHGHPGRTASDRGRVASGQMRDAVKANVIVGNDFVVGEVGWLEGTPEYARYQELGFRHAIAQKDIPGMESLREAEEQGTDELLSEAERVAREL